MTTKFTTSTGEYLAVGVPETAVCEMNVDGTALIYQLAPLTAYNDPMLSIELPWGYNYTLIATTPLIEEQAAEIVDKVYRSDSEEWENDLMNGDWVDGFASYNSDTINHFMFATDSFKSLLTSLGITERVAILKFI